MVTRWRRRIWAEYVVLKGEIRNAHKILIQGHEGMRSLGISMSRWDNIVT
jgi:hypothetical protein